MKIRPFIIIVLLILFTSCHGDFHELSDKYVYCEYTIAKSPSNSRWTREGKYIPYQVVIGRMVTNYSHDDAFIIAHQTVQKKHRYWIIKLADDMIWGPLTKDSFDMKCQEQNVKIRLDPRYESDIE